MKNTKRRNKLFLILFIYSIILYSCVRVYDSNSNNIRLVQTDTIVIKTTSAHKIITKSINHKNDNILFIDYSKKRLVEVIGENVIRSVYFDSLFNSPSKYRLYQHFFYVGNNKELYFLATPVTLLNSTIIKLEITREYILFKVDSTNQIIDTIKIANNTSKNFYIQNPIFQLPIISNKDSMVFPIAVAVTSNAGELPYNNYQINNYSRMKMFSQDCVMLLVIKNNNKSYFLSNNISYPSILLDTNISFYDYFPYIIGKTNEILTLYRNIDTLYSYNLKTLKYNKYPFSTKHKTSFISFDKTKIFDYNYINKIACEQYCNLYMKNNDNNKQTYIIIKQARKYENEDGTINKASEDPFSIVVLDSNYSQIGEFDISEQFIKHNCFVYKNGIALLNMELTQQDTNGYLHFVVFETKDQ